ncbi:MAG TPA: DUF5107 domain-containing protein, partial [Chloroflexi bacterium]|nr:DUF5107 domain-containing protein [Chloroflexota bacterium]
DCAYFTVRPRAENPTDRSARVQFWTNAMVTLGSHSLSPSTEFVYPTAQVLVHSAGPDGGLPGERSMISWPVWEGRDLSRYENWGDWLGFFVPQFSDEFVGAYNYDTDLGVVRTFSRQEAPGVKLFAWGVSSPLVSEYTDDGSQYFEIWGGPNLTFWPEDDIVLQPGDGVGWTEHWYPFQGIGGLDYANRQAAVTLRLDQSSLEVGLATSAPRGGVMVLRSAQEEFFRQQVSVSPEAPYLTTVPVPSGLTPQDSISISFLTADGEVVASYEVSLSALEG